jgi:hypothetical protein
VVPLLWVLAVLGAGGIGGYLLFAPTHRTWMEDVLLEDGSTIVVKRGVTFREEGGGGTYNAIEQEATIAFTGEYAGLPRWSAPLMAMVLYRDATRGGQWVIVATTTTCDIWSARGEPRPPYWEFRLGKEGWTEVPLSPTSIDRPTNLYKGYNMLKESHVTPEQRNEYDKYASDRYRFVSAKARSSCPHSE